MVTEILDTTETLNDEPTGCGHIENGVCELCEDEQNEIHADTEDF